MNWLWLGTEQPEPEISPRDLESTKTNVEYQTQSDDQKVENAEQNLNAAQTKAADAADSKRL
ncbi:MAG: hypothetical protein ACLUOI_26170 [Eisenbergiella sp.]